MLVIVFIRLCICFGVCRVVRVICRCVLFLGIVGGWIVLIS